MMENKKIVRVTERIVHLQGVHSLGVIGDPGCEGLGASHMRVYANALAETAKDDITLVVGDLVPVGTEQHYRTIGALTETLAENPVYCLRGNHDTGTYSEWFGEKNYALLTENFAVIVLDNAFRSFEQEGLSLLSEVLAMDTVRQAVIAFHIPVPNHFIQNCVSEEEFARLRAAYTPWKEKVRCLLCGHVHSRFRDEIDGIPLVCTGGGGAMIEDVSKDIRACDIEHHVVHFYVENGVLKNRFTDLAEGWHTRESEDALLHGQLLKTVQDELMAHFRYLSFADRAERRGMDGTANLFRALAASEYYHARNFFSVLDRPIPFSETIQSFLPGEKFEYEYLYKMAADYAHMHQAPLSEQAYNGAAAAEKVHAMLLQSAEPEQTPQKIYVCPICGYVMTGDSTPDRCPVCGGPQRQFEQFPH